MSNKKSTLYSRLSKFMFPRWLKKREITTLLQFIFDTRDNDLHLCHVLVAVKSYEIDGRDALVDPDKIEDFVESYIERANYNEDKPREIVEDMMNHMELSWYFIVGSVPASKAIHSFYVI